MKRRPFLQIRPVSADLLGYGKRVVYLDAEKAHSAFQLRVLEKELYSLRLLVFLYI